MKLIFRNAETYNQPGSAVCRNAKYLESLFEKKMPKLRKMAEQLAQTEQKRAAAEKNNPTERRVAAEEKKKAAEEKKKATEEKRKAAAEEKRKAAEEEKEKAAREKAATKQKAAERLQAESIKKFAAVAFGPKVPWPVYTKPPKVKVRHDPKPLAPSL